MAAMMLMNEETWQRHANPWSGYSRMLTLPLLVWVLWNRRSLGNWTWIWLGILMIWNWLNPRLFRKPKHLNAWMSKAVLGERIWLQRRQLQIPPEQTRGIDQLVLLSASGMPWMIYGVARWRVLPALFGMVLIYAGKLLFLDRMAKLKEARSKRPKCR